MMTVMSLLLDDLFPRRQQLSAARGIIREAIHDHLLFFLSHLSSSIIVCVILTKPEKPD